MRQCDRFIDGQHSAVWQGHRVADQFHHLGLPEISSEISTTRMRMISGDFRFAPTVAGWRSEWQNHDRHRAGKSVG